MSPLLHVLVLTDTAAVADVLARELDRMGFELAFRRATTEAAYLAELEAPLDLILADNALSEFDAMRALQILRASERDIPLIVVADTADEAAAIECVSLGASDFVFKDRLARLRSVVVRALDQRELRAHARAADAALRESEERFRTTFEQAAVGIAHIAIAGQFLRVNKRLCEIVGYSHVELLDRTVHTLNITALVMHAQAGAAQLLAGQIPSYSTELSFVRKDDVQIWINVTVSLVRSDTGMPLYFVALIKDITERHKAEVTRELLATIVDASSDAIIGLAPDGTVVSWNSGAERLYGYRADQMIGQSTAVLGPPHQERELREQVNELLGQGEQTAQLETVRRRSDGQLVDIALTISVISDPSGNISGYSTISRDISERKRADRVLRQKTAFIQLFQEVAAAANQATAFDQALQTAIDTICAHIGWPIGHVYLPDPATPGALMPTDIWHLDDVQRFTPFRQSTALVRLAPGVGLPGQAMVSRKAAWISNMVLDASTPRTRIIRDIGLRSGFVLPVLLGDDVAAVLEFFSTEAIEPDEALLDVLHHVGTQLGRVVERARAEAAQRESEARFRALFEHSPDAIILIDPHASGIAWPIVECNDLACQMNGYTRAELIGQSIDLLNTKPGDQAERTRYIERLRREGTLHFEDVHRRADGSLFPIEVVSSLIWVGGRELVLGIDRDISERKRAEEALRAAEVQYRTLVEQIPAIIYTAAINEQSSTRYVSPQIEAILGFTPEEWLANPDLWLELVHPDDRAAVLEGVQRTQNSDLSLPMEYRAFKRDGSMVWLRDAAKVVRNADGQALFLQGITLDITDRKRAEEALRAAEVQYRTLVEQIPAIIYTAAIDEQSSTRYVSPQIEAILGFTPEEWLASPELWLKQVHPDDRAGMLEIVERAHASDVPIPAEYRSFTRDGRLVWLRDAARVVRDDAGQPLFMQGITSDITDRKLAEAALAEREAYFRALIEHSSDAIALFDTDGRILYGSPATSRILGYAIDDFIGRSAFDLIHPEDQALVAEKLHTISTQPNANIVVHARVQHADGSWRDLEGRFTNLLDDPAVRAIVNNYHDVTESKRAEEALRESERLYRTLASNFPNGAVVLFDHDLRFTIADGARLADLGFTRERTEGHTLWDVYSPEECVALEPIYRAALAGMPHVREVLIGEHTYVIHTLPVRDDSGQIVAGMKMSQDITDRKRVEEALIEERALLARRVDERTADLSAANAELARTAMLKDEFLASMSHELRTPLNAVLGLSEALQEEVYGSLNDRQRRSLASIEESGRHLLDLINDILDLAKIGAGKLELDLELAPIEPICQASLRLIKQLAHKKNLSLDLTIDPTVTLLNVDTRRLKQVLVNLLSNAVKFTSDGGSIGLEVVGDVARQAVDLTVWDTGIGIAHEQMSRLFQPFVQLDSRLARQYEGTGLGLALVYRMVEMHGGSVAVTSAPGRGSRFTVALPWPSAAADPQASAPAAPNVPAVDRLGIRRALIVEDSPTTADQIMRYLHELAIESDTVANGAEVVALASAAQPDLILLDLLLPDISGWDVLALLKADPRTRAIPVVIISVIDDRSRGLALGAAEYLVKPVARADFQRVLPGLAASGAAISHTPRTSSASARATSQPVILLAEDNEANILMISDYLDTRGYQVVVARNGAEAVARARETRPAMVLMDIQMPGMDGLEATRRIRTIDDLVDLPIIALTALAMPGDRERCLAAGANDYLSKPVSLRGLAILIEHNLHQHTTQQRNHL